MSPDRQGDLSDIRSKAADLFSNLAPQLPELAPEPADVLTNLAPQLPELGRRGDGRKSFLEPIHARPEQGSKARRQKRDEARYDYLSLGHEADRRR